MDGYFRTGINITARSPLSGSTLAYAVEKENIPMIEYLFMKGGDLQELNHVGQPLLEWAEEAMLKNACDELKRLGATKCSEKISAEMQIQDSVAEICRRLLTTDREQIRQPVGHSNLWLALGACLWPGNDTASSLIALDYGKRNSKHPEIWTCGRYDHPKIGKFHLCQRSIGNPLCEYRCLKTHEAELREHDRLKNHKHLIFPRPFCPPPWLAQDHVAMTESEFAPVDDWLKSLENWKCKPEVPSSNGESTYIWTGV